jgi:hypothetical protein
MNVIHRAQYKPAAREMQRKSDEGNFSGNFGRS